MQPENDTHPPVLHNDSWHDPVPLPGPVNSAGLEDSPYITKNGNMLYFFFTPSAEIPSEKQLGDGATGIYRSIKVDDVWQEAVRVLLAKNPNSALDGCPTFVNGVLWFCSIRKGNYRDIDFWQSEWDGADFKNIRNAGKRLNDELKIGEMDISSDGNTIIFHQSSSLGDGNDINLYQTVYEDGTWSEPLPLNTLNSSGDDSRPAYHDGENEIWFTRTYRGTPAVFRTRKAAGVWNEPELIISQFAGEPSLDSSGNIYFVHHFFKDGIMLEADIYIAYKK